MIRWYWARTRPAWFYPLFALSITESVQLAGRSVSRVCESDPAGALAAHDLSPRARLALAYGLGVGGYVAGLWLSVPLDLPSGPLAVCTLAFLALLSAPLSMLISGRARNGH